MSWLGNGTNVVTVTGTAANIDAALSGLTYQGILNYNGSDTLTVVTNDNGNTGSGGAKSDTDTVTINVTPINDPPVGVHDSYTAYKGATLTVAAAQGVLANDTDVDGDPLTVDAASIVSPSHGTLNLNSDGSFTYTPTAGYTGLDSFSYKAKDPSMSTPPTP